MGVGLGFVGMNDRSSLLYEKNVDAIESEVYVIEPLGSDVNVIVKLPTYKDFKFGMHDVTNVKVSSGTDVKVGDKVWLKLNKRNIQIFNKSGEIILWISFHKFLD